MENKTESYIIDNPQNQNLIIFDVGVFKPGKNTLDLTKSQVHLLEDNAILTFSKASEAPKTTPTVESAPKEEEVKADEPVEDKTSTTNL
jgi:hypothetical protein